MDKPDICFMTDEQVMEYLIRDKKMETEKPLTIDAIADCAYNNAVTRGKITSTTARAEMHRECCRTLYAEFVEMREASEVIRSSHLPEYTETEEEITDILIGCLTELRRRKVNVAEIVKAKIAYNETRILK